jgi:hypothetical protein
MIRKYTETVNRVSLIDKDAAKYLRNEAPKMGVFSYSGNIRRAFVWSHTPQGTLYWRDIFVALNRFGAQV